MKKTAILLLIIFIIALFANVYVIIKYTGKILTIAATEGTVSLLIEGRCGDSVCSSDESCSACPQDCGTCPSAAAPTGGGGAPSAVVTRDFFVDQTLIKVMVRQGESFKTSINIKNTEKIIQSFDLAISPSLEGLVYLSENKFTLQAGEEKTIYLTFVSTDETKPEVYTGNLEIKTSFKTKKIPVIFSVKSKLVLFDVSLDIPAKYKDILPGEELLLQLTLFNLGEVGKTDISVEYMIKDFEGNVIIEQKDIVAVETQVSFSKMIKLPPDIKPGDYVAIAQARYDSSLGSSSVMFRVTEKEKPDIIYFIKNKYFIIVVAIIILFVFAILFLEHERKKMRDIVKIQTEEIKSINKKIKGKKVEASEAVKIKGKLKKQLDALERAYSGGYITNESYEKGKKRIQNLSKKLRC